MKVRDIMTTDIISVEKDRNLKDVMQLMQEHNITKLPVVKGDELVGIVTDGGIADKLGRAHNKGIQTATLRASGVMHRDFVVAHPDESIEQLAADVGKPGLTMIPVVQGTKLVGVVTKADLLPLVESDVKIGEFMARDLQSVSGSERLVQARRLILDHDVARLPVLEGGILQGIIAEHEIAGALAQLKEADVSVQKARVRDMQVVDYMRREVVTGSADLGAKAAAKLMMDNHVGCLPIVDGTGHIEGMITRTDLIRTFAS